MRNSLSFRRRGLAAAVFALSIAGCIPDPGTAAPMSAAACPEGLALTAETIGLSYVVVRVDSCAAHAGRFALDHVSEADSGQDVFLLDEHTGWLMSSRYPIRPGSVSHYRVTAYFRDSTRLVSGLLTIAYPDSAGDFAPIEEGQSFLYAYRYNGSIGSNGVAPDSSEIDTGLIAFRVLSRRDSSGTGIFRIEYRDSIVRTVRPNLNPGDSPVVATRISRDTTRCLGAGDSVVCDPVSNAAPGMRFPWAKTHIQRAPYMGMIMPAGGAATSCAHETNRILPYGEGRQAVYLPGTGMIQAWESSFTPHSGGIGSRSEIRLIGYNGADVDYRAQADLCSRDFPAYPAP